MSMVGSNTGFFTVETQIQLLSFGISKLQIQIQMPFFVNLQQTQLQIQILFS